MTDASKMNQSDRDKLLREIEQIDVPRQRGKPVGLVSVIARCCHQPRYTIADINRMAMERGISYGQMVLELDKRKRGNAT